jgi:AcrR family transcriptional regulator
MSIAARINSDAREKLMSTAEKLFAQQGYPQTSVRQIAGAAGLNLSLISYYFGSKEALYKEVFVRRLDSIKETLANISWKSGAVEEKLNQFLNIHTDMHMFNRSFLRLLYREFTLLSESVVRDMIIAFFQDNYRILDGIIIEGCNTGEFKKVDTSLFFLTIIGMVPMVVNGAPFNNLTATNLDIHVPDLNNVKLYLYQILKP